MKVKNNKWGSILLYQVPGTGCEMWVVGCEYSDFIRSAVLRTSYLSCEMWDVSNAKSIGASYFYVIYEPI